MNPQDDPEARIRDLERPLADRAQSSELGTQPYSVAGSYPPPPPPPPPPGYAAPYQQGPYPTAQPYTKPSHTGVIVLVVVVLVLLVMGSAVAIYFANQGPSDEVTAGRPVAGGGGSIDLPDVLPTGVPPIVVFPGGPGGDDDAVVQAPTNGPFSVSGIEGNKRIQCNDSEISISGVSNTVAITGHCASVTVSGVENQVTVENADTISASGFDNRIRFRTGEPAINNSGDNVVERG